MFLVTQGLALCLFCKTKKNVAVTFAVPVNESVEQLPATSPDVTGGLTEDAEVVSDTFDIVDERTSLLRAEGGQTVTHVKSSGNVSDYQTPEADSHLSPTAPVDPRDAIGASNVSLASISSDDDVEWVDAAEDRALTATSQSVSVPSTPRQKSSLTRLPSEPTVAPAPPLVASVPTVTTGGDMYHWMKRQQDFTASRLKSQHRSGSGVLQSRPPSLGQESWTFAGASEMSHEDSVDIDRQRYVTHSAFQLADAQV